MSVQRTAVLSICLFVFLHDKSKNGNVSLDVMLHKAFLRRALPRYQGSDVLCVKWNLSEVQEHFWPYALSAATNIHMGDIIIIIIIIIIISDVAVSTSACQAVLFCTRR